MIIGAARRAAGVQEATTDSAGWLTHLPRPWGCDQPRHCRRRRRWSLGSSAADPAGRPRAGASRAALAMSPTPLATRSLSYAGLGHTQCISQIDATCVVAYVERYHKPVRAAWYDAASAGGSGPGGGRWSIGVAARLLRWLRYSPMRRKRRRRPRLSAVGATKALPAPRRDVKGG